MRGSGIDVVLIEPGPITTKFRANAIPKFEKWINPEASARSADYEASRSQLYGKETAAKFELPAEAVAEKLLPALTAKNPKPRYFVTTPTYISAALKRLTSTRLLDRILSDN